MRRLKTVIHTLHLCITAINYNLIHAIKFSVGPNPPARLVCKIACSLLQFFVSVLCAFSRENAIFQTVPFLLISLFYCKKNGSKTKFHFCITLDFCLPNGKEAVLKIVFDYYCYYNYYYYYYYYYYMCKLYLNHNSCSIVVTAFPISWWFSYWPNKNNSRSDTSSEPF